MPRFLAGADRLHESIQAFRTRADANKGFVTLTRRWSGSSQSPTMWESEGFAM